MTEIKTVPYVPLSHPFVERLIGTLRRECLDRTLFWTATDLEGKLLDFQHYYYNEHRMHAGRQGHPPVARGNADSLTSKSQLSSMAEALSRFVPDPDCRLILVIRHRHDSSNVIDSKVGRSFNERQVENALRAVCPHRTRRERLPPIVFLSALEKTDKLLSSALKLMRSLTPFARQAKLEK